MRVFIPKTLQKSILKELHIAHTGIIHTKGIARIYVWWNGIDKDTEELCSNYTECASFQNNPPNVVCIAAYLQMLLGNYYI